MARNSKTAALVAFIAAHGPVTTRQVADATGAGLTHVPALLGRLVRQGRIVSRKIRQAGTKRALTEWRYLTDAEMAAAQPNKRLRACLCCGDPFVSQGSHNRLCVNCRRGSLCAFDAPARVLTRGAA